MDPRNTTWNVVVGGGRPPPTDEETPIYNSGSGSGHDDDPLHLQNSDHPGMALVSNPLSGNNFHSWSRAMKIALGAKTKLGFIDGRITMPDLNSSTYEQWKKVDCMVVSWILNSMSKEMVEAFLYANSAKELWDEITQRFGECNGPLLYQLQKEITNLKQRNDAIAIYFTKLKKLWDEFSSLMPIPNCSCGTGKVLAEVEMHSKPMQFLMGLNNSYDHVRSQILLMEPLPNVNKAYSMVLRVEKQRNVQIQFPDPYETAAMSTKTPVLGRGRGGLHTGAMIAGREKGIYGRFKEEKAKLTCEHCKGTGHDIGECFKLHGYPDWYKKLKEQRSKPMVNMTEAGQIQGPKEETQYGTQFADMAGIIQQEVAKYMAGKVHGGSGKTNSDISFAHLAEYAGPAD